MEADDVYVLCIFLGLIVTAFLRGIGYRISDLNREDFPKEIQDEIRGRLLFLRRRKFFASVFAYALASVAFLSYIDREDPFSSIMRIRPPGILVGLCGAFLAAFQINRRVSKIACTIAGEKEKVKNIERP